MYTRQRTRKSGGTLIAPKALAPTALGRESDQWEGSESRVPEWGSVAGSPGRQRSRGRDTFPAPTRG